MELRRSARGRVLLADDNEVIRKTLAELLADEGWEVIEAQSGRETLEQALKERPDVLVLDYRMPEITGGQVYQLLRSMGVHVPVVLITADAAPKALAARLGIRYVLGKPFRCAELIAVLERARKGG